MYLCIAQYEFYYLAPIAIKVNLSPKQDLYMRACVTIHMRFNNCFVNMIALNNFHCSTGKEKKLTKGVI
jgi:hypothetical protein